MSLPNNLQLCRLCLFEKNSYVDIFEMNEKHGFRIADVINEMLELDVSPGDGFPERICHDCLNEMARFKRFKNLCQEAKLTLKYIIALATGAMPPPTSLPSFLNAAHGSTADAKKGTSAASSSTLQVCTTSSLGSSEPLISPSIPSSSAAPSISAIPSSSAIPASSSETVSSCAQVNLEDGDGSSTANGNYDTCHITPPPSQLSGNQVDNEQQTVSFADGQEDSDIENLCDEPLPVETVLSEPDTEVDHGNRSVEEGIAAISQNGEREDSFGMFPISSIINDLHQFSSYIPPGTRLEHSIFDKQKEPEVVDLVDDDEDEDGIRRSVFPFAQTLVSSCNESGSSRPESDSSVIIKTEGNEDSDLENMCEHPLPVETVLSEPDGEMGSASGGVKCENSQNESESRDDSFGLFSLTSTFGDLMTSAVGEGNGCLPRNQHTIIHSGQPSQNNSSDAVARPLENPNKYPFWCHICGKNFMRKDKLKQHSVVHSNERPFICRICGCSYKRKDKLTSHVTSSHLQHLPHQCDICGKRFVRKDKLKQHSVVHSNRRPYVCKVCSKKYKSKIELKKHEKRAHAQVQPL